MPRTRTNGQYLEGVTARLIGDPGMKQRRTLQLPWWACLNRESVAHASLGDPLIRDVDTMQRGLVERRRGSESGPGDDLIDPAIETLNPSVGWGGAVQRPVNWRLAHHGNAPKVVLLECAQAFRAQTNAL